MRSVTSGQLFDPINGLLLAVPCPVTLAHWELAASPDLLLSLYLCLLSAEIPGVSPHARIFENMSSLASPRQSLLMEVQSLRP